MIGLRRHIPELAIEWQLEHPERLCKVVDGTLCFADISGFTALAERLAQQGRIGGEELVETLSRVFGAMLDRARERDGMLLKFGGDALLFLFRGEGHALRAASTAVEMRTALRQAARVPTSVGQLRLSMSVGLHSGPIHFFLVGSSHRELILAGEDASMAARTEGAASAGEIAVSAATAALLPASAVRPRDDGTLLLRWRQPPGPPGARRIGAPASREVLRNLFPARLGEVLEAGAPEPEHRMGCIAFVRFSGTDELLRAAGPDAVAEALQATVAAVQEALDAEGVTLLTIDLDNDGGKLFLGSGVPRASEDDEGLMLRALCRIHARGTPLPLQSGVNRGHVFAAEVGTDWRAAYSAMGDTTNTAARICARAPPGAIYAHPSVLDNSRTLFETRPEGPFRFKGKKVPQVVYRVGEETGTRSREGREELPLTGRAGEVAVLRQKIADLAAGTGGVLAVRSAMGLGKSRLLKEAIRDVDPAAVIRLRAEPYGANSPYRVFRDPVRKLLGVERGSPAAMAAQLDAGARRIDPALAPWTALLGDVAHVQVPASPEVAALEPRFRPERTADTIVRLLAAARPLPLVFLMDDAQWTDEASEQLLARLANECLARPWLLLVARRPGDEGFTPQAADTIELEPLGREASTALLTAATEAAPLRPFEAAMVVDRAGGNPLFIEEIVQAAREAGSLESLPGSLEAAIAAQIDALDPLARRILRYASVLGNSFRRPVLAGILGAEGEELDDAALSRAGAFLEDGGDDYLRFRRALVRDTAYEGLAYRVRRRLHQLAGEAAERAGGDLAGSAAILARHFSLAGDAARTWHYARLGADRARDAYANPEAANLYRLALDAARRLPGIASGERVSAWTSLGDVCRLAGLFEDSLAAYRSGYRLAGNDPVARAELLRRRALARERAGSFQAALRELAAGRRLLAGLDSLDARRMRAKLGSFAAMIRFAQQRYDAAVKSAEAAAREARDAAEPEALAEALVAGDSARLSLGDGRTDGLQEALAIYQSLGDLSSEGMVSGNIGCAAYLGGRWDEALDWFARDREIRQRAGSTVGAATAASNIGEILVKRGQLAEAEVLLRDASRAMRATGYNDGAAYTELQLARALVGRNALVEAIALVERISREFAAFGQPASALEAAVVGALARIAQGNPAAALELLAQAAAGAGGATAMLAPQVAEARARALAALGDTAAAAREIDSGIAAARGLGMPYEEAMLLEVRSDIARAHGLAPDPRDVAESLRILKGLGAAKPRGLPEELTSEAAG
ncbi:MAG: AAA family ATPase [Chromatiales bacterium]|nr:AAA family ATPase [Chromatiales bacterium]